MRNLLLFIFLCIPFFSLAQDSEECSLSLDAIQPLIDEKDKSIKKVFPITKESERILNQSVLLNDNIKVIYSVRGCAHYGYTFTYENVEAKKNLTADEYRNLALSLLKRTPLRKDSPRYGNGAILIKALEDPQTKKAELVNGQMNLPCGDATCVLNVQSPKQITISYDFAL